MSAVFRSHHILPALLPYIHPKERRREALEDGGGAMMSKLRREYVYRVARQDFPGTAAYFASEVSPIKCAGREFAGTYWHFLDNLPVMQKRMCRSISTYLRIWHILQERPQNTILS